MKDYKVIPFENDKNIIIRELAGGIFSSLVLQVKGCLLQKKS